MNICENALKCKNQGCPHKVPHQFSSGCDIECEMEGGIMGSQCKKIAENKPIIPVIPNEHRTTNENTRALALAEALLRMRDIMDEDCELCISFKKKNKT